VIVGVEVFSLESELFFSVFEFEEEGNFMFVMRITSINEEPLGFITSNINGVEKVFLDRLTLDIIRESGTIDVIGVHGDHQGSVT